MRDEIFDRTYQSGRAELNAGIDRAVQTAAHSLGASLKALHRIEWSAPWQRDSKRPTWS